MYGAVKHHGQSLDRLRLASIDALRDSGLTWALLSPNSVMETSLLSQADSIKRTGAMWGCAGDGKVGLIAADDAAAAGVALLRGNPQPERSYEVTGPEALSMADVAERLAAVLGTQVAYNDMPEDAFRELLVAQAGMPPEEPGSANSTRYQEAWMLDHVGLDVSDYDRSKAFYERALAPLGLKLLMEPVPGIGASAMTRSRSFGLPRVGGRRSVAST